MALFVLLSFSLILEVHPQDVLQPRLTVSSTGRSSFQLDCERLDAGVSECYFYPESDFVNRKTAQSCRLSLTDSELEKWTGRSSRSPTPASVICYYYTMSKHGYRIPSPHSAPVLILDAPQLSVSPSVIREQGVVQLNCEPPLTGASMCYFYPERDNSDVQPAQSCQLFLTRSELKHWAGHSSTSSEPVSLVCYYTVSVSGVDKPSIHSPPAPVWILDKKPIISVDFDSQSDGFLITCEIPLTGSVSAEFKCNLYTGHLLFLNGESRRGSSGAWNCVLSTSKNDLLNRLWSVKSSEVTCDYSLNSDPTVRSPLSDPYDVSRLLPAATQSSITAEQPPEDSPGSSTHFSSTTDSTPSESPFSVSLLATNNHVTHCCQTPTDLPKTGFITASSVPELSAETTMLSPTAVNIQPNEHSVEKTSPDTETAQTNDLQSPAGPTQKTGSGSGFFQYRTVLFAVLSITGVTVGVVVSGGVIFCCSSFRKPRTNRLKLNSTSGNQGQMMAMCSMADSSPQVEIYSEITSSPEPSGPSRKAKAESETREENDIYHMYCTIPDIKVAPKQNESFYSLLENH